MRKAAPLYEFIDEIDERIIPVGAQSNLQKIYPDSKLLQAGNKQVCVIKSLNEKEV